MNFVFFIFLFLFIKFISAECDASKYNYLIGSIFYRTKKCFLGTNTCVSDLYNNRLVIDIDSIKDAYPGKDRLNIIYDRNSNAVVDIYCEL